MADQSVPILIDAELQYVGEDDTQKLFHLLLCLSDLKFIMKGDPVVEIRIRKNTDKDPGQGKAVNVVRCLLNEIRDNAFPEDLVAKPGGIWN